MGGISWKPDDIALLLHCLRSGLQHDIIETKFAEEVPKRPRTLQAIRSKSAELQKDPSIYNSTNKEWIAGGFLISRLKQSD
jgi:hypothetical protein